MRSFDRNHFTTRSVSFGKLINFDCELYSEVDKVKTADVDPHHTRTHTHVLKDVVYCHRHTHFYEACIELTELDYTLLCLIITHLLKKHSLICSTNGAFKKPKLGTKMNFRKDLTIAMLTI